jgi:hypothetical protein
MPFQFPRLAANRKGDAVGRCIYCDAHGPKIKLTAEHIIAFSLGGTYVLPKASCLKCADATKRLEGYAGRHIFQDVRIEHGFPTRNPKERPTHLPLRKSIFPTPKDAPIRLLPTTAYSGALILTVHEPAGIILGKEPGARTEVRPFILPITDATRVANLEKQGIPVYHYREIKPDLILRLIAKIALGYAVASVGLDGFEPAAIRETILQRAVSPFYLVGGSTPAMIHLPNNAERPTPHKVMIFGYGIGRTVYVAAQIQLFAYLNAPIYTVIVGKMTQAGLDKLHPGHDINDTEAMKIPSPESKIVPI